MFYLPRQLESKEVKVEKLNYQQIIVTIEEKLLQNRSLTCFKFQKHEGLYENKTEVMNYDLH